MKIVICDDSPIQLELSKEFALNYLRNQKLPSNLLYFNNPVDVINTDADIYLLDMIMPQMNGIDLAKRLRKCNPLAKIIFITSDHQYAVESYKVNADGYLLKPLWETSFNETMSKIINELKEESIQIRTNGGDRKIPIKQIMYVESSNRCLIYHLNNGEDIKTVLVRSTIKAALGNLPNISGFVYLEPSLLINMHYIKQLTESKIEMDNGEIIYFPQSKYKQLRETWKKFCNA